MSFDSFVTGFEYVFVGNVNKKFKVVRWCKWVKFRVALKPECEIFLDILHYADFKKLLMDMLTH